MAKEYTQQHQRAPVSPAPQLKRLYPDHELQSSNFEAQKPIQQEPLGQKSQRIEEPHYHYHPRRDTIEYETASDFENSPIPTRATRRFKPLDISPFAQEPYNVTESQLQTPTETPTSSEAHPYFGQVKRLSGIFEDSPKLRPVPKERHEVVPRYQPQKLKPIEKQQKITQRYRPRTTPAQIFKRKINETVRINGDEYGVLENTIQKDTFYTAQRHNLIHRHLLEQYTSEDHFLDQYLRSQKWDIPVYLVPNAQQNTPFPLQPTHKRRISMGVLLRRKRLSTSAPSGLDRIHLDEARHIYPQQLGQQISGTSTPMGSSEWSVKSPLRSKSTPFVYSPTRIADLTQGDQGELFRSTAFIKARQHSDAFVWGSIHRHKGREIAQKLDEANKMYDTVYEGKSTDEPVHKHQKVEEPHSHHSHHSHQPHQESPHLHHYSYKEWPKQKLGSQSFQPIKSHVHKEIPHLRHHEERHYDLPSEESKHQKVEGPKQKLGSQTFQPIKSHVHKEIPHLRHHEERHYDLPSEESKHQKVEGPKQKLGSQTFQPIKPHHHREEERHYHHEYDVVYETKAGKLQETRHSHDHGYRHSQHSDDSAGYEPIPLAVRRVQQQQKLPRQDLPPQLPSTPPPKSPKSFAQIVEDKPISVAERLLTKTPSFERRHRHATTRRDGSFASDDKPPSETTKTEQRLSPFGTRKMYTSEKKKWFDEEDSHSINDQTEEIHRAVNALRHIKPPEEREEQVVFVELKEEDQENLSQSVRANLRHVESGSLRRKRRHELSDDPYIRHPSTPGFRFGLYFAHHPFLTYLTRLSAFRGRQRYYSKMPELTDGFGIQNGSQPTDELLQAVDNDTTRQWDPTALLEKMYRIDYNPLVETRTHFRSMEGHLEVPNDENITVPEIEKPWKSAYFRIKEGRFQFFSINGSDENPDNDILLVGTKITANKNDWTFKIEGGKENVNLLVRAPSNVFEKWRLALLSNAASQLVDTYVQPVKPPVPHYTNKVAFIELGSCSVRAGILTNKPSLPQVFFPAVACLAEDTDELYVGFDALKPEVRRRGRLHRPIEGSEPASVERFQLNSRVVEAVVRKAVNELKIDPTQFKVLVSIAQDVPTAFVGQLLRLLLQVVEFSSATIARQPSLILYSYDVTTGVVVDIGERLHIVPVIDEYIVDSAIVSLPFGAQQLRDSLKKRLNNQLGAAENTPVEHFALREIVKQVCSVSTDSSESGSSTKQVDLTSLGAGFNGTISVDSANLAAEGLFEPQKWGMEIKGIHHLIHSVIQQSPIDSRRTLYRNIYLSGGTSLLPGLAERLESELLKIAPPSIFVQVHGSPYRYNAAYLGAQVIATSHQFDQCCANKDNVEDYIKQVEADVN